MTDNCIFAQSTHPSPQKASRRLAILDNCREISRFRDTPYRPCEVRRIAPRRTRIAYPPAHKLRAQQMFMPFQQTQICSRTHAGRRRSTMTRHLCAIAVLLLAAEADARDPTNMNECLGSLKPAIEARCRQMYADQRQQASCLQAVAPQVRQTCQQFFGAGQDFCAVCTSSCTQSIPAGDPRRRECLSMCLAQPKCR